MQNEALETRIEKLRDKASIWRSVTVAFMANIAVDSVTILNNMSHQSDPAYASSNTVPASLLVASTIFATYSGLRAIQTGQEVAALAAVQAQQQVQTQTATQL